MFAVVPLETAPIALSFKCSPENFAELIERPQVVPAPYLARAQWVALEDLSAIPRPELKPLLKEAYDLVKAKLSAKTRSALA